jgi:hypothetical protein
LVLPNVDGESAVVTSAEYVYLWLFFELNQVILSFEKYNDKIDKFDWFTIACR